ncbi:MAG: ABC transporter substrate-binding protein [Deltaproteobacteria bacterium]|nr:ABC transporter substrate-binding protein [Deltaproteobacteria bacterium]
MAQTNSVPKLEVAFIGTFTGPQRILCETTKEGLSYYNETLKGTDPVRVTDVEMGGDEASIRAAFEKLSGEQKYHALILIGAPISNTIAPLAEAAGIPTFAWTRTEDVARGRRFVIRTMPSAVREGEAIAGEAKMRGMRAVAVFAEDAGYSRGIVDGFKRSFPTSMIVSEEFRRDTQRSYTDGLIAAQKRGVRDVFTCLNAPWIVAREARMIGMTGAIFGCDVIDPEQQGELAEPGLSDAWFVSIGVAREFRREFGKRFGTKPFVSGAAIHADLMSVLRRIAEHRPRGTEIIERVLATPEQSGALTRLAFVERDGDQFLEPAFVVNRVRNGALDRN